MSRGQAMAALECRGLSPLRACKLSIRLKDASMMQVGGQGRRASSRCCASVCSRSRVPSVAGRTLTSTHGVDPGGGRWGFSGPGARSLGLSLRALPKGVFRSAGGGLPEADEGVSCSRRPLAQLAASGGGFSLVPAQWSLRKRLRLPHWCSGWRWILAGAQGARRNALCSPRYGHRSRQELTH